jgi:hypothetical protein
MTGQLADRTGRLGMIAHRAPGTGQSRVAPSGQMTLTSTPAGGVGHHIGGSAEPGTEKPTLGRMFGGHAQHEHQPACSPASPERSASHMHIR